VDEAAEPAPPATHSTRLATYALWWMRIMLTNSVIDNRGIVVRAKSPKVRKALFGLPAAIRKLNIALPLSGGDVSRISVFLGIDEQYIEEALIHAAGDVMLDEPIGDGSMLRGDVIADQNAEGENGILRRLGNVDCWDTICTGLMELSPRDRFILITRHLLIPKWKLDRLSETLQMSRERIRQIGCDGLARIRAKVGPDGARHNPARNDAVAAVEALVSQIEQASVSTDPAFISAFLKNQKIAIGPTRIVNSPRRAMSADSVCEMHPA
jgi:DNA-directed RNA polymerase sigma subunit (sigma70/sigma32)